jgi:hypothetical protein
MKTKTSSKGLKNRKSERSCEPQEKNPSKVAAGQNIIYRDRYPGSPFRKKYCRKYTI